MVVRQRPLVSITRYVSKETTVHGLNIVGLPKLNAFERIFWLLVVAGAAGGAISLAHSNWTRYVANPTVVSLQKDFRNWQNPFPAVTGCFVNKTDKEKAKIFIKNKWGLKPSDENYQYYMDFLKTVANASYLQLEQFTKFQDDTTLSNINMLDLAMQVHPELTGTLVTFDPKRKPKWKLIMSELGLCFSVNSKFADLFAVRQSNSTEDTLTLRCHYLNGLCYARYDSDPQLPLNYYIHSYLDVIHSTVDAPLLVRESEELEINYRMQETTSAPKLRDLNPSQRRCRFDDEPLTKDLPAYSTSICYILCRHRLALKLCGCKPFFYHFLGGKTCNIKGLLCLAKYAKNITQSPQQIGCQCPQPCNLIKYLAQVPKFTKWEHGYFDQRITFRWGLLPPTTKYRRDVLFTFEDLVVSFGGTVALFLGISFISVMEIIFLIIEGLTNWFLKRKIVGS